MKKMNVNGMDYEYEIEGVFDSDYALRIIRRFSETSHMVVHWSIHSVRPSEEYIRHIIEQVQKTL